MFHIKISSVTHLLNTVNEQWDSFSVRLLKPQFDDKDLIQAVPIESGVLDGNFLMEFLIGCIRLYESWSSY